MAGVSKERAALIERRWHEGVPGVDIAAELGCPLSSVRSAVRHMRDQGYELPYRANRKDATHPELKVTEPKGFRHCLACDELKPEIAFPFPFRARMCFECRADASARSTARRKTPRRRDPVKLLARREVATAIRSGRLLKPSCCPKCGRRVESRQMHAHHRDYARPLDVEWLCRRCHQAEHAQLSLNENNEPRTATTAEALTSKEIDHAGTSK